jgi:hypothetical protein
MFSGCLYSATGKVVQFPVKGSCSGDNCHCKPFHRELPWNSYKFPEDVEKKCYCNKNVIERFDDKFLTKQQKYNKEHKTRYLTSPHFQSNEQPTYHEPHVSFLDKIHYDLHNDPLNRQVIRGEQNEHAIEGFQNRYAVDAHYITEGGYMEPRPDIKWSNKDAYEMLVKLSRKFGKPYLLDPRKGGVATWKNLENYNHYGKKCIFHKIMIKDEAIKHLCPSPHVDFLYSFISVDIPHNKYADIMRISGSIGYDPLKKSLYARCASLEANIATLKLATDLLTDKVTIKEIHENKLYEKLLNETVDQNQVKNMYQQLYNNLIQTGEVVHTGYYSGAFTDDKCSRPTH